MLPRIAAPLRECGAGSAIGGRVTLGANAELSPFAALRADGHVVQAGNDLFVGWRGTVHIAHRVYGAFLGHGVSIGARTNVQDNTIMRSIEREVSIGEDTTIRHNVLLGGAPIAHERAQATVRPTAR